jgi:hypothetical protein
LLQIYGTISFLTNFISVLWFFTSQLNLLQKQQIDYELIKLFQYGKRQAGLSPGLSLLNLLLPFLLIGIQLLTPVTLILVIGLVGARGTLVRIFNVRFIVLLTHID